MIEKYGVEYVAITDRFKAKVKEMANFIRNTGKEIENNVTISPTVDLKSLYKWREEVQKLLKIQKENQAFSTTPEVAKTYDKDIRWYETSLKAINDRIQEIEESEEEVNKTSEKTKSTLGEMFDKSISKIKRFTYYLLGARSVFSLFMKYQSIYYQYNEQMQYQNELAQNAIALGLAPAFEFLGNMVIYASIAFAKFIELLTGVNILSKVATKGIRNYNKSLKETQTLISGIDEITNLTMPSGGGGTGLASQYQALEEFQKKVKEVEEWFDKQEWLKGLAKGLKTAFNYISDHWDVFKYIFGGVAIGALVFSIGVKLAGVATALGTLGAVGGVTSVGTGLAGLASVLGYLATFTGIVIGISVIVSKSAELAQLLSDLREARQLQKEIEEQLGDQAKENVSLLKDYVGGMHNVNKGTEEWNKQIGNINALLDTALLYIENGRDEYDDYIPAIQSIGKELTEITGEDYTAKINLALEKGEAEKQANSFFGRLGTNLKNTWNSFLIKAGNFLGGNAFILSKFGIHEKGLDYVPYDNYPALLHKGESVVPAKYNPQIHSIGNEYTNSLLETMVMKLDDYANRPIELDVDGKKFANATYGYYDDARNRQGYVEGVVR